MGYEKVYDDLATALLVAGRPQQALDTLNVYRDVTGRSRNVREESTYLRAVASYQIRLDRRSRAKLEILRGVPFLSFERYAGAAHRRLSDAYAELGNDKPGGCHAAQAEGIRWLRGVQTISRGGIPS